jgi:hypothetical protein
MNTDEFEDRLKALRTNPDMVAYYPRIAAPRSMASPATSSTTTTLDAR